MKDFLIAPSILSADFARLGEDVEKVLRGTNLILRRIRSVPRAPAKAAIARAQGQGDVFGSFAGGQGDTEMAGANAFEDR